MRSDLEVADILRRHDNAYAQAHDGHLGRVEREAWELGEVIDTPSGLAVAQISFRKDGSREWCEQGCCAITPIKLDRIYHDSYVHRSNTTGRLAGSGDAPWTFGSWRILCQWRAHGVLAGPQR